MRVAESRPKTIVAARLRENKYGQRTAEKMRSAVLLFYVVFRVIRFRISYAPFGSLVKNKTKF